MMCARGVMHSQNGARARFCSELCSNAGWSYKFVRIEAAKSRSHLRHEICHSFFPETYGYHISQAGYDNRARNPVSIVTSCADLARLQSPVARNEATVLSGRRTGTQRRPPRIQSVAKESKEWRQLMLPAFMPGGTGGFPLSCNHSCSR